MILETQGNDGRAARVFVAGLFHETHCFLDQKTARVDFEIKRGIELWEVMGDPSPLGGALEAMKSRGWEVVPGIDYRALPSGVVEDEVVEQFWAEFCSRWTPEIDAVFLVLHGAMVSASYEDVEGELLARLRRLEGADQLPVFGVYDLHANFSPQMARHANALLAYRTNPHVDARLAAIRSIALLERALNEKTFPRMVLMPLGRVLAPLETGSEDEPMRSLLAQARQMEAVIRGVWGINVAAGFAYGDTADTGASVQVIADPSSESYGELEDGFRECLLKGLSGLARERFTVLEAAALLAKPADGTTVLVEVSDNIGAGAPGDGTGALRLLVEKDIEGAAVALCDAEVVEQLRGSPPGELIDVELGGKGSRFDLGPMALRVELVSVDEGRFRLEDPTSHLASISGAFFDMGPCAVVRYRGIRILVTSRRTPPFDLGQWRSQGIEPSELRFVVVKAAVAHRQAYDPIAALQIVLETPGPCSSDLSLFPYARLTLPKAKGIG